MNITTHPINGFNLRSQDAAPGASPRSSGIHLSGILRKMALQYGKLPAQYANSNAGALIRETPVQTAGNVAGLCRMAFGMAWEPWIVQHVSHACWGDPGTGAYQPGQMPGTLVWPGFIHQPGEFTRDNILATPDGLSDEPNGYPAVHEFKFTWKSSNRQVVDEWLWLAQVVGYAAMVSATLRCPCLRGYLHVAYAMGDYSRDKPQSGPQYRVYQIDMEQEEVERAWAGYLQHVEGVEPEMCGEEA